MNNMRIWDAVQATDPKHTKKVEFGRKFTSIDAHWQIMRATEQFGPVGEGWGYDADHSVITLTPEIILAVCDVSIWRPGEGETLFRYGPIRATCEMYGPKTYKGKIISGEFVTDEDAPKKAMTDALTKGLSHLGFSADVFLGLFDDNRYVQKMEKEFRHAGGGQGDALAQAGAEIAAQTGNDQSTYKLNAAKAAKTWADTAIDTLEMALSPEHVDQWREDNAKALDRLEKNHIDEFKRVDKKAEEVRENRKARAA